MPLSPASEKKLHHILRVALISTLAGGTYGALKEGLGLRDILLGMGIGFVIGTTISIFERFVFDERFRRLRFAQVFATRTAFYIFLIISVLVFVEFLSQGIPLSKIPTRLFFNDLAFSITVSISFNFLTMVNRMLGSSVLRNFITGKYYKPIEETRIFMFLDLQSSTTIAEKIGHFKFHDFLNDCFFDLTEPILESKGYIYKYVGDEVIVTWLLKKGVKEARCLRCFFSIFEVLTRKQELYVEKYGVIPQFKAGLHCGPVVVGQMGDDKQEIAFLGDTVNTTARIQAECNRSGKYLLVSSTLLNSLPELPPEYKAEPLGPIQLRGKAESIELCSVERIRRE